MYRFGAFAFPASRHFQLFVDVGFALEALFAKQRLIPFKMMLHLPSVKLCSPEEHIATIAFIRVRVPCSKALTCARLADQRIAI